MKILTYFVYVFKKDWSIKEIAHKYKNVQKGVGEIMRGPLLETSARRLKNEAETETKKKTALRMLKTGKLTIEEIAEYTELKVSEVEQLVGLQIMSCEEL